MKNTTNTQINMAMTLELIKEKDQTIKSVEFLKELSSTDCNYFTITITENLSGLDISFTVLEVCLHEEGFVYYGDNIEYTELLDTVSPLMTFAKG